MILRTRIWPYTFPPLSPKVYCPVAHPSALSFELANSDLIEASILCVLENNDCISSPHEQIWSIGILFFSKALAMGWKSVRGRGLSYWIVFPKLFWPINQYMHFVYFNQVFIATFWVLSNSNQQHALQMANWVLKVNVGIKVGKSHDSLNKYDECSSMEEAQLLFSNCFQCNTCFESRLQNVKERQISHLKDEVFILVCNILLKIDIPWSKIHTGKRISVSTTIRLLQHSKKKKKK